MDKEEENLKNKKLENTEKKDNHFLNENIIEIDGMYKNWFLEYASYVILERAVPHINDGLKPVQRRILHSMKELEDGRYNKVANVVGNTMKYHPHGDASITDAMIQIGQKNLLIDTQGNWGNIHTGDSAAAARYIEARFTKFALEVIFNPKTTNWQNSYDGRNKEPITFPVKFPLLLAQGVEGIAVGMACKILPHNFIELIDCSIKHLMGKPFVLLPDFVTGGYADFSNYNDGLRGGRIRVRAKIEIESNKILKITEIPFGTTTSSLIYSIIKANDRGKIKIKKVEDNTAENIEILIHLAQGISPDISIDALYAFSDCELSISPNTAIIRDNKPEFLGVTEILKYNTQQTVDLLKKELEIELDELKEKWHFASLEKIFIEQKIYVEFDEKTYEEAKKITFELLQPHIKHLIRNVSPEDIEKLMEIKMRRITKHDVEKADTFVKSLEEQMEHVKFNLSNLIDFAIKYYKELIKKYAKKRERKTEIKSFETIEASKVAITNEKLYVNYEEGFVGYGLKKGDREFISDCSDLDDIVCFSKDGIMSVSRITKKSFIRKNLLHVAVWKKGDKRTIYNIVYLDMTTGYTRVKRFYIDAITRDREYNLTKGEKKLKILYLSANPNGEAEIITVILRNSGRIKKLKFDYDFSKLEIKGKNTHGNLLTKHTINKVILKEEGVSTLSARKIWYDNIVERLNIDGRGIFLGQFLRNDKILQITKKGEFKLTGYDLATKFEEQLMLIEKWNPEKAISLIYYDGQRQNHYVKRFFLDNNFPIDKKTLLISEHTKSKVEIVTTQLNPIINISFDKKSGRENEQIQLVNFIQIKGANTLGNKLTNLKIKSIELLLPPKEEIDKLKKKEFVNNTNEQLNSVSEKISDKGKQGSLF